MTVDPINPVIVADETTPDGTVRSRTGMPRLSVGLIAIQMGWSVAFSGASSVLLAAKIAQIAPDQKIALLATITIAGSIAALLANVFCGALSDLTRSRFGSRTPWIIGGALAASALMYLLSTVETFDVLVLVWCLFQAAMNAIIAPSQAFIADRVTTKRRGTITSIVAFGTIFGITGGAVLGAQFLGDIAAGMRLFGVLIAVLPIIGVLIAPDFGNRDQPRPHLQGKNILQAFAFPSAHGAADFYWALFGRLTLILGYFMVNGYVLYILTDYIKLSQADAAATLSFGALLSLAGNIVGALVGGPLSDRIGRRKLPVFWATVLFAAAIAIPLVFPTAPAMLAFYAIGGLGFGAYSSVDGALMTEVLPNHDSRGKDLAILNTSNTMGQILAPVASAGLVGLGLGFLPVFAVAIVACLVGAAAILPIKSVK